MEEVKKVTELKCCNDQRLMMDESFSYECQILEGKLWIDTSDYCTDGFENLQCINCGESFDESAIEMEW